MIIKGGSRGAPNQLGRHLARADTNERVSILQLQSPASSTTEAFEDWQTLAEGTRGHKGLYHANIDPAAQYRMSEEQWFRAVDVLEEELGLQGQPRAVVLHEKNGRTHIHVVWARTDVDTMTLRSDSHNFQAHERASLRLEQEFGHEIVPGKHAKRDREAQPEMPSSEINHGEWQQAERGALDHRARKEQVKGLYEASDSGAAFKAALEDAGYILARGDRRDFVIMDADGRAHSLGRQLPGVTAKELRGFMAEIDPAALPGVKEARAERKERAAEPAEPRADIEGGGAAGARAEAIRAATLARQAEELAAQEERQGAEISALQERQLAESSRAIDAIAREQARAAVAARPGEPGFWQNVKESLSPERRAARLDEEAARARTLELAHETEMRSTMGAMETKHRSELHDLVMKQAAERDALMNGHERELARRLEEVARAAALERELQRREHEARDREGPERDGRAR